MKNEYGAHLVGAIPFDTRGDNIAVLFVTSQTRGRWVLPKGKRQKNENHLEACQREVFEEAGVRGPIIENFPLTTVITKQTPHGKQKVAVTYYPMLVTEQAKNWPEKDKRERQWALVNDAQQFAHREDLLDLIRQFEMLTPWIAKAAIDYQR